MALLLLVVVHICDLLLLFINNWSQIRTHLINQTINIGLIPSIRNLHDTELYPALLQTDFSQPLCVELSSVQWHYCCSRWCTSLAFYRSTHVINRGQIIHIEVVSFMYEFGKVTFDFLSPLFAKLSSVQWHYCCCWWCTSLAFYRSTHFIIWGKVIHLLCMSWEK